MHSEHLIKLSELYARHERRSPATISNRIAGHARLFSRLQEGKGTTIRTYEHALVWFARNWPSDLEWPVEVPRPKLKLLKGAA